MIYGTIILWRPLIFEEILCSINNNNNHCIKGKESQGKWLISSYRILIVDVDTQVIFCTFLHISVCFDGRHIFSYIMITGDMLQLRGLSPPQGTGPACCQRLPVSSEISWSSVLDVSPCCPHASTLSSAYQDQTESCLVSTSLVSEVGTGPHTQLCACPQILDLGEPTQITLSVIVIQQRHCLPLLTMS